MKINSLLTAAASAVATLLVAGFARHAPAQTVKPPEGDNLKLNSFAQAITLTPNEPSAIHTLLLPDDVYRGTVDSNLADLRVYNQAGQQVPHAIRPQLALTERVTKREELPLFPLRATPGAPDPSSALALSATRDKRGVIIRVEASLGEGGRAKPPRRSVRDESTGRVTAYLLDLSQWQGPIDSLHVTFERAPGDYVVAITVEASDDLSDFRRIGRPQSLVHLDYGGNSIDRSQLVLPRLSARYLRLTWGGTLLRPIASVQGESGRYESADSLVTQLVRGNPESPDTHLYDLKGAMPIDGLRLVLTEDNVLVNASISGADDKSGPFRPLHQGIFYRIRHRGALLESPSVPVARTRARYVRMSLSAQGGGLGTIAPDLELARRPDQLLFAERGEGPFELAFGHYAAPPSAFNADELLGALPLEARTTLPIATTTLSAARTIAGPSARAAPPPPAPVKKYILWAVLFAAVLLLTLAARSLIRANNS